MEKFLGTLETLPDVLIYLLLGLSAFVENLFPPIPGDVITLFGAFLVGIGELSLFWVYLSTTLGSLVGFLCLFQIGRYMGRPFFIKKNYRFFKAKNIVRVEKWFSKYGYLLIVSNRFFPGIRSVISLAGGISRLKLPWVALLALLSSAVWNLIWILAGYMLGNNWYTVETRFYALQKKYNLAILIFFLVVVIFFTVRHILKKKKKTLQNEG
jgi:membrane protein DedA with SNARE-associated domain